WVRKSLDVRSSQPAAANINHASAPAALVVFIRRSTLSLAGWGRGRRQQRAAAGGAREIAQAGGRVAGLARAALGDAGVGSRIARAEAEALVPRRAGLPHGHAGHAGLEGGNADVQGRGTRQGGVAGLSSGGPRDARAGTEGAPRARSVAD